MRHAAIAENAFCPFKMYGCFSRFPQKLLLIQFFANFANTQHTQTNLILYTECPNAANATQASFPGNIRPIYAMTYIVMCTPKSPTKFAFFVLALFILIRYFFMREFYYFSLFYILVYFIF
jgi:hypothetical protein